MKLLFDPLPSCSKCDGCGGEWPCDTLRALMEGVPSE